MRKDIETKNLIIVIILVVVTILGIGALILTGFSFGNLKEYVNNNFILFLISCYAILLGGYFGIRYFLNYFMQYKDDTLLCLENYNKYYNLVDKKGKEYKYYGSNLMIGSSYDVLRSFDYVIDVYGESASAISFKRRKKDYFWNFFMPGKYLDNKFINYLLILIFFTGLCLFSFVESNIRFIGVPLMTFTGVLLITDLIIKIKYGVIKKDYSLVYDSDKNINRVDNLLEIAVISSAFTTILYFIKNIANLVDVDRVGYYRVGLIVFAVVVFLFLVSSIVVFVNKGKEKNT